MKDNSMRLQKFLAACGVSSRRGAEELILAGEIRINGEIIKTLGTKVDPEVDEVKWKKKIVTMPRQFIYLMINKPAGYICSRADAEGRDLVLDLLKQPLNKLVKPVGRLDFNSTGLLLLSNDGEFINLMTHPSHQLKKKYKVKVRGEVTPGKLEQLLKGVTLEDGFAKALEIKQERISAQNAFLLITVGEGRNHLIKRMCLTMGLHVVKLSRIAFGPLTLQGLKLGEYRELTAAEVEMLKTSAR